MLPTRSAPQLLVLTLFVVFTAVLSAPTVNDIAERSFRVTKDWHVARQWPVPRGETQSKLTYCYKNEAAQKALEPFFEAGWRLWADQPNFPTAGLGKNRLPSCPANGLDTLIVSLNNDEAVVTTVGYEGGKEHTMSIDAGHLPKVGNGDPRRTLAHEIGHALCLIHEHQKKDAQNYVEFKCENLADYGDVSKKIQGQKKNDGSNLQMKDICTNMQIAGGYGASAYEFAPWIYPDAATVASAGFDFDSIMLYSSNFGGKRLLKMGPRKDVLTRKDDGKPFEAGKVPSPLDIQALRDLYL